MHPIILAYLRWRDLHVRLLRHEERRHPELLQEYRDAWTFFFGLASPYTWLSARRVDWLPH